MLVTTSCYAEVEDIADLVYTLKNIVYFLASMVL